MVPYSGTLQGRLAKALDGKTRVYSFAAAGAPLSQYLIWARYAVQEYGAKALLINVVGNDFDESHAAYAAYPGFWHYVPDADQQLRLRLFEYRPSLLGQIVVSSALGRYLLFNLQAGVAWTSLKHFLFGGPAMAQSRYAGNTSADAGAQRVSRSLAAPGSTSSGRGAGPKRSSRSSVSSLLAPTWQRTPCPAGTSRS